MMADDGPVPMDLGNVCTHDAKMTHSDSDTSNDMSYDDVCAIAWTGNKAGKRTGKKGPNGSGVWRRGEGADESEMMEERKEARRARKTPNLTGTATRTREALRAKGKARAKVRARTKPDTTMTVASKGISG